MFYKLTYLFITLSIAPSLIQNGENPFVRLEDLSDNFYYDMRYATENNFLKKKLYQCDDCIIRTEVASALIKANEYFNNKGYSIKFYDCYRPLDIQKLMWEVFPNAQYVANPEYGSIHNRGGAVDITLVYKDNVELDMGTEFDHFGEEAHHSYTKLSKEILANRALLKEGMEMHGFTAIRTEWWHYNFGEAKKYAVSNFLVECNE
jgi:zinc D-Ala-D-Ala dipeptidase